MFYRLQIILGCSWYVLAIGGITVGIHFPALFATIVKPWTVVLFVVPVAMFVIHKLKLSKK